MPAFSPSGRLAGHGWCGQTRGLPSNDVDVQVVGAPGRIAVYGAAELAGSRLGRRSTRRSGFPAAGRRTIRRQRMLVRLTVRRKSYVDLVGEFGWVPGQDLFLDQG